MHNIVHVFFKSSRTYPNNISLIYLDKEITYSELESRVLHTANYFKSKGLKRGDKVLVFVPMSIKLYVTVLALFSLGVVVVFVDQWSDLRRLRKALKIVHVDAIVASRKLLFLGWMLGLTRKRKRVSPPKFSTRLHKKVALDINLVEEVDPEAPALITFTTGSTGLPKAAERSHSFLKKQFEVLSDELAGVPEDRFLVTLPIVLLSILGTGGCGIIAEFDHRKPENLRAEQQIALINKLKVNVLVGSPFYVRQIATFGDKLLGLSRIFTGGAPVFPDVAEQITQAIPHALAKVAYGSTEAEPISTVDMKEVILNENGLLVGKVHPDIAIKIIKIYDGDIVLDDDGWERWEAEFGEIIVAGDHVLKKYHKSEAAFRRNKIADNDRVWHRTGDSGRLVDDLLYLSGRCSELIETENGYCSLFLLEYELSQIAGVRIGTFVDKVVFVEIDESFDRYHVSTAIDQLGLDVTLKKFVKKLPRDPRHHSKIDYAKLRQMT